MTAEQFWEGDPSLAKYYRKAEEMRIERRNQEMWLQGMYVYEAICDASPLFQAFAKKGVRAHPYSDKPYSITENQKERNDLAKEKAVSDKGKRIMEAFMKSHNSKFENK